MTPPPAGHEHDRDQDLIDVPIAELRVTPAGRSMLADRAPACPNADSELALDILFAVACWQARRPAPGRP